MKKWPLFILILGVIILLALADLYVNVPGGMRLPALPSKDFNVNPTLADAPNYTKQILDSNGSLRSYVIERRTRSTELFEVFNLTEVPNISVYKNMLISPGQGSLPVYVYEIQGPVGQGAITYLNVKLEMIKQLGSSTGINETGNYGYNSLFYNYDENPSNGLLLSQVGDTVFGFKYNKESKEAFDFVTTLVNNAVSLVTK